uniref:Restriction endonuclease subunit S n=1 Tax=Desertifilum tharense IPPAS B-1220 TaxID=1781255 RepID=A0ACD5GZT9_9CYAN
MSFGVAVQVLTDIKFVFQRHIAHLKPDHQKINSTFLATQMNSNFVYSQAKKAARGAAQPTVNLGEIREFKIILPPLPSKKNLPKSSRNLNASAPNNGKRNAKQSIYFKPCCIVPFGVN